MPRRPDRRGCATGRRRGGVPHFAKIPCEVIESDAVKTLPHAAFKVLVILASQYRGKFNGDLALTENHAKRYGFKGRDTIYRSLRELKRRHLIVLTREGWKSKTHFALYGLGWLPVNHRDGMPLDRPEPPTRSWETFRAPPKPPREKRAAARRRSGLPVDPSPAGLPIVGNDQKKLPSDHRESSVPKTGNGRAESFPIVSDRSPVSVPTIGNTSRISEGDERGAPERTRARLPSARPHSKILRLIESMPNATDHELARILGCDVDQVRGERLA